MEESNLPFFFFYMYYFIFLLLSPLIKVLSSVPPDFKFLSPEEDGSSSILVTHLFLLHLFIGWSGQIQTS